MPIWMTTPVGQQPMLHVTSWRIYETEVGERHVVGWCVENREGRVSSAIVSFDLAEGQCTTDSGRVYQLQGASGFHSDAAYTLLKWCRMYAVPECRDVTDEVEGQMLKARLPAHNERSASSDPTDGQG